MMDVTPPCNTLPHTHNLILLLIHDLPQSVIILSLILIWLSKFGPLIMTDALSK